MKKLLFLSLALLPLTTSCLGVRSTGDTHTVHAESFNLLGLSLPSNERDAAWAKVPAGAEVITATSSHLDWTSFWGVLSNIFGFSQTTITWRDGAGS